MQIFTRGIKGNCRESVELGEEVGVSLGVEETKGDKIKNATG